MSEQTDATKVLIKLARSGDQDALKKLRYIGVAVMEADDGSVPPHIQIAVIEYIIRLQDEFHESN